MYQFLLTTSLLLGILYVSPALSDNDDVSQRIFDGQDTSIESVPSFVTIGDEDQLICGGAIIHPNWIVTTAQCVAKANNRFVVRAGTNQKGLGGSVHHIDTIIPHEHFSFNDHWLPVNNLALVRVKEAIEIDSTRRPISLFESSETVRPGTMGKVSGFGISRGPEIDPKVLQSVDVPVMDINNCEVSLAKYGGVPQVHICAAEEEDEEDDGGSNACFGDQGGPLVVGGRLAGLVSHVFGCSLKPHLPVIYTDVGHYHQWIKNHLRVYGVFETAQLETTPNPEPIIVIQAQEEPAPIVIVPAEPEEPQDEQTPMHGHFEEV